MRFHQVKIAAILIIASAFILTNCDNWNGTGGNNGDNNGGNQGQYGNLKPCAIRLYDGDNFSTTDDSVTIKGPGHFSSLANLEGTDKNWNAGADSYRGGTDAAVTFWTKTNFEGDSVYFDPGTKKGSLEIEPSSVKISCE